MTVASADANAIRGIAGIRLRELPPSLERVPAARAAQDGG